MSAERWVIAANVVSDSAFRKGAKVLLAQVPGNQDQVEAYGLSKGGRRLQKWIASKRLTNFRPAFVASSDKRHYWPIFATKEQAAKEIALRFPPPPDPTPESQ